MILEKDLTILTCKVIIYQHCLD